MWRINVFISACCCTVVSVVGGRSRLHLLDLGSCGRAKDGSALSLTSLGSVLLALLSGQRHIPHRSVSTSSFYPSATYLDWPKAYCFLLVRPSVRLSVHSVCQSIHSFIVTVKHDILKTSEPILLKTGKSGPRGKEMKRSASGVRRSKIKIIRYRS